MEPDEVETALVKAVSAGATIEITLPDGLVLKEWPVAWADWHEDSRTLVFQWVGDGREHYIDECIVMDEGDGDYRFVGKNGVALLSFAWQPDQEALLRRWASLVLAGVAPMSYPDGGTMFTKIATGSRFELMIESFRDEQCNFTPAIAWVRDFEAGGIYLVSAQAHSHAKAHLEDQVSDAMSRGFTEEEVWSYWAEQGGGMVTGT